MKLSNPQKLLWPGPGISKRDLAEFHRRAWPLIEPYITGRALTVIRYPDGVEEEGFFQKHDTSAAQPQTPIQVHGVDDLLELANLAAISIHIPAETLEVPDRPQWITIDIDAKQSDFQAAVKVARAAARLARDLGVSIGFKTSGKSGLHALIPVSNMDHEQCKLLARLFCSIVADAMPQLATTHRSIQARGNRIYVDPGQNGAGKTAVAPFSPRAVEGATVSMPVRVAELNSRLSPERFTISTMFRRTGQWSGDPLAEALSAPAPVAQVIERLEEKVNSGES